MLQRQDYLLRLIEQFGRALAGLLDRIPNRTPEDAGVVEAELDALAREAGMDLSLALRLTPETLGMMVAPGGTADPGRCWLLAELLYLRALQAERERNTALARQGYERSLALFRMLEPGWRPTAGVATADERIPELASRLQGVV